jgi:mannonate dehydratase
MNRRKFVSVSGAAAVGLAAAAPQSAQPSKPSAMKLGCQTTPTNEQHIRYLARYGVQGICAFPQTPPDRLYATADELKALRDMAEKNGVTVDLLAPPFLASISVDRDRHAAIMLGQSPERDRDIEQLQTLIRNCAAAGIPAIKYNLCIVGDLRNLRVPGRGDCTYTAWRLKDSNPANPLTRAGRVDADTYWERVTYFLNRVIPVAEEYKVRMALHPNDPYVPYGYQGVDGVLGTVEGLKKFITINESPYHGLNFCQGTVSEMLEDPAKEIFDVIRYFGARKKIFNVHFRNIRGHRDDFVEVYPDEGDIDFVKAMRVYKELGYPYMIMPDHVPQAPGDPAGLQSFAYCYGYIRALMQAVDRSA